MLSLIILLIIIIACILLFRRYLHSMRAKLQSNLQSIKNQYKELNNNLNQLKQENQILESGFEKQTGLYEMTKLLSKTLNKDEAISIFKNNIFQFIECKVCRFLDEEALSKEAENKDFTYLALKVNEKCSGSFVIEGLNPSDKDTLTILLNQLNLILRKISLFDEIQHLSITDSLTQVFNRRYLLQRFQQEFKRAVAYKLNLSAMMVDIDFFKQCNDKYGHLVGDTVLSEVANIIKVNIRNIDFLGRFGGEEFLVILPATSKDNALVVAKRVLTAIEKHTIKSYDESIKVTLSLGISSFPKDTLTPQDLIDKSDFALYRAKKTGRDKICIYGVYE